MPKWPVTEAAVVTIDEMEDLQVFWPEVEDDEAKMPEAARYLVAIACKWKSDPEFVQRVLTWYEGEVKRLLRKQAH